MTVHVHKASQSVLLRVPDPFLIRDLFPQSYTIDHPNYNAVVRHTPEAARVLRNLGYPVPSPIFDTYRWPGKYKPKLHQKEMVLFHTTHPRGFNLSEMGTMKTAATLWAADILMLEGTVQKAAILAPLSTLDLVWGQDIFDVLMHRLAAIVHGGREQRQKALAVDADFYIINHDGLLTEVGAELHARKDINLIIVDEGSMFRNGSTDKYKALMKMLRPDQQLWWLTGTPCPNAPTDAWAQARLINPNGVPQFFGSFRRQTMTQISQHKWVRRLGAEKIVYEAMQPAIRFAKKDCIDLPPVVTVSLQAPLSDEQRAAFKTMKNYMTAEMKTQQTITAVNAADKINKLRQILCGSIKDPETGKYITINHKPRLKVLREAIESASAKVIIIVPFKGITEALETELKRFVSVGVLNGDVPFHQRRRIISDFKNTPDPQVLLCHPKVMAHGLNLTEADTIIFYAPIYSNDEFQQVIERFNRMGQKNKMTIVKIGAHPLEWEIYRMIDTRKVSQDNILKLYRSVISQGV